MSSKLEELKQLRKQLNIEIEGLENYPKSKKTLILANHNCLMDIFYLPMAIPIEHVSVVSSRVLFKNIKERQVTVNKYLNSMPMETGNKKYATLCLEAISDLFAQEDVNLNFFPEGAYFSDKKAIYRGRTGASRVLFHVRDLGIDVSVVPVAIDVIESLDDIDDFHALNNVVKVKILEPMDYEEDYYKYSHSEDRKIRNEAFHAVMDKSLQTIANALEKPYINEYIPLNKKNVILPDGSYVDIPKSNEEAYLKTYNEHLEGRVKCLYKHFHQ